MRKWLSRRFFAVSINCAGILWPWRAAMPPCRICSYQCSDTAFAISLYGSRRSISAAKAVARRGIRRFPHIESASNSSQIGYGKFGLYFRYALMELPCAFWRMDVGGVDQFKNRVKNLLGIFGAMGGDGRYRSKNTANLSVEVGICKVSGNGFLRLPLLVLCSFTSTAPVSKHRVNNITSGYTYSSHLS